MRSDNIFSMHLHPMTFQTLTEGLSMTDNSIYTCIKSEVIYIIENNHLFYGKRLKIAAYDRLESFRPFIYRLTMYFVQIVPVVLIYI